MVGRRHSRNLIVTRAVLIILLILVTAIFWWLQPTTPERIGSLVFVFLVSLYAIFAHREDVLGACIIFFGTLDVSQYLFDHILPIWIGVLVITAVALSLWLILFGRTGWFLAVASTLAVLEVMLALQYVNLPFSVQAFMVASPFIAASQYYYFGDQNGERSWPVQPQGGTL